MLFDWLRRQVKNSVVAGINDAIAELSGATAKETELPEPIRLLLPAPATEEEPIKGRRGKTA